MTVNYKTTVLGTREETDVLLEHKQSCIENKKPLAIKESPKPPILNTKRKIFLEQIDIHLQKLNKGYHIEFVDCFEDLPHDHKLPTDIYHCIKLKNSLQIFITRTYLYSQKL